MKAMSLQEAIASLPLSAAEGSHEVRYVATPIGLRYKPIQYAYEHFYFRSGVWVRWNGTQTPDDHITRNVYAPVTRV